MPLRCYPSISSRVAGSNLKQSRHALAKLLREHVVGVVTEPLIPKAPVGRIDLGPAGPATTAEGFDPVILDPGLLQCRSQVFPTQLGELLRTGKAPDVDEHLNAVLGEQAEPPIQRMVGM